MKLPPYPEYKDAGVNWVGSIPSHWPEKRAKYYFKEIDERSQTGDEEMLSVSHITGVTPRSQKNVTMFMAESNVGQKRCQPGDLIINTMWAWMSALGVSNHDGIVSPAYGVYRPISNQDYDYYYLDNLLRIEGYRSEYICRSTGIRSSRLRLYPDKFLSMPVVCPPQEEQQNIARFLKAQDSLFSKFIRNKRRLIEMLKEQKQNVINQAVTRGLDPNVKLKPSGVEWIGDIPANWELSRVKREFRCLNNQRIPLSATERGAMKQRLYDYYGASGIIDKVDDYIYDDELLLIAEDGANLVLRNLQLAIIARGKFWVNNHAHILKPKIGNIEFLAHCLEQINYLPWISGAAQPKLTKDRLMAIYIAVPSRKEQDEIVEFIKQNTATIDYTITRAQREIELMREYRTRLISDVATGQVDVRGIEVLEVAEDVLLALEEDPEESDDLPGDEAMEAEE